MTREYNDHPYLRLIREAGLPEPDEIWHDGYGLVFSWSTTGFSVHLDPERDDCGPIDELEAAMMKGLDPSEWPWPSADGYLDYVPDA